MKKVYTDLDSIFDTRVVMLGLLTNQGEYEIGNHNYIKRVRDNFGTLSDKIFHYYYKYRSNRILNIAPLTSVLDIIKDYALDNIDKGIEDMDMTLYVNIYPYNLSSASQNLIKLIILKVLPDVNILFINVKLQELEPHWVKENIDLFISYTAIEWLNYSLTTGKFIHHPLLDVMILAPFRLEGTLRSNQVNDRLIDQTLAFLRTICDFNYLDIATFCGKS